MNQTFYGVFMFLIGSVLQILGLLALFVRKEWLIK